MDIQVVAPNLNQAVQQVTQNALSPQQLLSFTNEVAKVAEENILNYLAKHIRTGQTFYSIRRRLVESSPQRVSVAVGSDSRAFQLRILDKGRGEVYPIRAKRLRFTLFPSQIVIFARHSRAVPASGIMSQSAELALAKSKALADSTLRTPNYVK